MGLKLKEHAAVDKATRTEIQLLLSFNVDIMVYQQVQIKWSGSIHIREPSDLMLKEESHKKYGMYIEKGGERERESYDRMFSFESE